MPIKQSLLAMLVLVGVPHVAHCDVTDLPAGTWGGMFRDESTGKIWLDYRPIEGNIAGKINRLSGTPFRLATTAEVETMLTSDTLNDLAVGPPVPCPSSLIAHLLCKFGIFDDSLTGTNPAHSGRAGGIDGGSVSIFSDGADNLGASLSGAWAIQRLEAGDPYSLDFDGDGIDEKVVWRPSTGTYFVKFSASVATFGTQWGLPGDTPLVGDYDGDRIPDLAVVRPSNLTWFILTSSTLYDRTNPIVLQFGLPGDIPIRTDNDGDGRLDVTVWRNRDGNFYYIKSSNAQFTVEQWGLPGDMPLNSIR